MALNDTIQNVWQIKGYLVLLPLVWIFLRSWWSYTVLKPTNVKVLGRNIIERWVLAFKSIYQSPTMVFAEYQKSPGTPFAMPTWDRNYHVYVSSKQHVAELNAASHYELSFNDAVADFVHPEYVLHGFEYDDSDPNSSVVVKALKAYLRPTLPSLAGQIKACLQQCLDEEFAHSKRDDDGFKTFKIHHLVKTMVLSVNYIIIVGERLGCNPEFRKAAHAFVDEAAIIGQLLSLVPHFLQPVVGYIATKYQGAQEKLYQMILAEMMIRYKAAEDGKPEHHEDCMQYIIEASRTEVQKDPRRLSRQTLGLLFATAHQMPMATSFTVRNLAVYPEVMQAIRKEVDATPQFAFDQAGDAAPLLDSFVRETTRFYPISSITAMRKAKKPFTFSDGLHIPKGNVIGIPQNAVLQDESHYPNANEFNAWRFMPENPEREKDSHKGNHRFSHPSPSYPYWGSVKQGCPGRFYASIVIKTIVAIVASNYDVALPDKEQRVMMFVGPNMLPSPWLEIRFRERNFVK